MDFIVQHERIAHESYDVYNHLEVHQERALYQCLDAEKENVVNTLCGDYNSGKRQVLSWLVRMAGNKATLIAVASKVDQLKWKYHFKNWDVRIDFLPLWKKRLWKKRAEFFTIIWYERFIIDVNAWEPHGYRWLYNRKWIVSRNGGNRSSVMLASPFSFSLFSVCPPITDIRDWKRLAAFENIPIRLYSMLSFLNPCTKPNMTLEECPICRDCQCCVATPCQHSFCSTCLFSTFLYSNFKCPLCRSDLGNATFSWFGQKSLSESVLQDFLDYSDSSEFAAVYDPKNSFKNYPVAKIGRQVKICRLAKQSFSVPLNHVTHLFSTLPGDCIPTLLLKKYFSGFQRKKILKIFYIGN